MALADAAAAGVLVISRQSGILFDRSQRISSEKVLADKGERFAAPTVCHHYKGSIAIYELYYWPGLQGRGEFVRLALEEAQADYKDVARDEAGLETMQAMLEDKALPHRPFAPPFLKDGDVLIGQTANILFYLGPRLGLVPKEEAARLWVHQVQLTIADLVAEVHDSHHPVASSLYYEDQKPEAKRRAKDLIDNRLPKFLGWFDSAMAGETLLGKEVCYADLSLYQIVAGLRYAFPEASKRLFAAHKKLRYLHDTVAERPNIGAYHASARHQRFNRDGIFRHYPELDD
jgi:glutathione S-transferase